ncbi:MAG TPA: GNAT family N-acetyltransferase [Methylomirabilota bacterium]|nr:GNAT family N-acetyltransferase [Methylomirabilota bacterium]
MGVLIEALTPGAARAAEPALIEVLRDAVDSGASVGFLPPLAPATAAAYWRGVFAALDGGPRVLLVARRADDGAVVGTAQLEPSGKENGRHRAEVSKVLVLQAARRQGIGRALMLALETHARRLGRTTLVLDTREGDPSETLYASLGWRRLGVIPRYAESAGGRLDGSAFYYKLLDREGRTA